MPRIPGVSSEQAIRALGKAGFRVIRQGRHVVMSNGLVRLTIPRHNPINSYTMGGIASAAGLSPAEFKKLL
jgi:predicted RNA binding protein YcfA (HicA-like mRNA interferase family)